jgi:hypothetical protein
MGLLDIFRRGVIPADLDEDAVTDLDEAPLDAYETPDADQIHPDYTALGVTPEMIREHLDT